MSKVNVNTIEPSTGTDITLGASGDTLTVPSGATLDISSATLTPPATMPASSGVNLTELNASNLGSGTVPAARLSGVGKVGQVVSTHLSTTNSFSSSSTNTFVDLGISLSITPSATSSKIFIMSTTHIAEDTSGTMHIRLLRDSTVINMGTSLGSSQLGSMTGWRDYSGTMYGHALVNKTNHYLDSPSSTSAITYKLQGTLGASYSGTYYIGRSATNQDADYGPRWPSNLTAWEILA